MTVGLRSEGSRPVRHSIRSRGRTLAGAVLVCLWLLVLATPAHGAVDIQVEAPSDAALGEQVTVSVTVTDGGEPLSGVAVSLSRDGSLGGVTGSLVLARATSDENGRVVLSYEQRSDVSVDLSVEVVDQADPIVVTIGAGAMSEQVFRSETGVDIPGLSGWIIVGLITILWSVMVGSLLSLRGIAGDPDPDAGWDGDGSRERMRLVPIASPVLVTVIALVLLAVVVRNPATHGNLEGPDGHDRTPHAHIGEVEPFSGPGLAEGRVVDLDDPDAGSTVFFGAGCASCHGLGGAGGVVGDDLESSINEDFDEFVSSVRKGPKGMPGFGEETLTDGELSVVFDYLQSVLDE